PGVSASVMVTSSGPTEPFTGTVWSATGVIVGGVFGGGGRGGETVTSNVSVAVRSPSDTVRVMVAVPDMPAIDLTVATRDPPGPALMTTFMSGMSAGFDDVPVTVRFAAGVSESATVNPSGPLGWPEASVWSATGVIVGGVFG